MPKDAGRRDVTRDVNEQKKFENFFTTSVAQVPDELLGQAEQPAGADRKARCLRTQHRIPTLVPELCGTDAGIIGTRCLQIMMVAAHTGLFQFAQMFFRQPPQRGADPAAHVFRQVTHHSQQAMQLLLFQGPSAGHDADTAHGPGSQPQDAFTQFGGLQKGEMGDGRVVVAALGTKTAVHAAIAAAGIDDGAQADALAVMPLAQGSGAVQQGLQRRIKKTDRFSGRGGYGKNRMVHAMDPWGNAWDEGDRVDACPERWERHAPPEGICCTRAAYALPVKEKTRRAAGVCAIGPCDAFPTASCLSFCGDARAAAPCTPEAYLS